jgi:hypothetical protein
LHNAFPLLSGNDWKINECISAYRNKKRLHYVGYGDEEDCFGVLMHEKMEPKQKHSIVKKRGKKRICKQARLVIGHNEDEVEDENVHDEGEGKLERTTRQKSF